ncbi:MAG: hypothetical protein U0R76_16030 [Candidatus Nanopelagicales bacterium]
MRAAGGRAAVVVAATAVALLLLGGSAWAQTAPSPTSTGSSTASPSSSPSDSSAAPAVPTSPSDGATPSAPSTSEPPSADDPAPVATVAPTAPIVVEAPGPNDGVGLAAGQTDDYLVAAAAREAAARRVATAAAALVRAQSLVTGLEVARTSIVLEVVQARIALDDAQRSTDDVVRDLYQQGDAGLGAFATILAAGPQGFLDSVDNARMATSTAYGVVDRATAARARLASARTQQRTSDTQLAAARASVVAAQRDLDAARVALATQEATLTALGAAAPQVAVGVDGCPTVDVPATLRDGAERIGVARLCRSAIRQAATPQAALALTWAFQHLGAVYACKGVGRMEPWRADCSSFVSRAYYEGAGVGTAGGTWAPSTRDMVPWDGVRLDPHYAYVAPAALRPGDLVLYDTCPQGGCPYKHVVMYLGSPDGGRTRWMLHTNACGDVAKVTAFWGFPTTGHPFLVARRVVVLPGERLRATAPPAAARAAASAATHRGTAVVSSLLGT